MNFLLPDSSADHRADRQKITAGHSAPPQTAHASITTWSPNPFTLLILIKWTFSAQYIIVKMPLRSELCMQLQIGDSVAANR
jgi:hypothetical protein